jgi:drug/metabolite transporter (DMT)-like permease
MALESFPPFALVSTRFLLSGSILLIIARARGAAFPRGRELRMASLCGVLILGIGNSALVSAEQYIPSGLAGLMTTISPFWMVSLEALLPGGERLHGPTVLGMLVGLAGAALLLAPDVPGHALHPETLRGFLVLQLGMASWSLGSILHKRQRVEAHPIVLGAIHQLTAGVAAPPLGILEADRISLHARGVGALLYLAIFGSIVGYSAYAYALAKLPVALVSSSTYVNAVVAVILGWMFYREPFGWVEGAAMAIIFAGVALVKRSTSQSLAKTLAPSAPPAVQKAAITVNQNRRKKA